jgi:hypothetical protein
MSGGPQSRQQSGVLTEGVDRLECDSLTRHMQAESVGRNWRVSSPGDERGNSYLWIRRLGSESLSPSKGRKPTLLWKIRVSALLSPDASSSSAAGCFFNLAAGQQCWGPLPGTDPVGFFRFTLSPGQAHLEIVTGQLPSRLRQQCPNAAIAKVMFVAPGSSPPSLIAGETPVPIPSASTARI